MTSALRWKTFASAAVAINLISFLMVRAVPRPAVAVGAAFDVAVTVPALYFLLIVRGGLQPLISIIPLILLGLLRATWLTPQINWARPLAAGMAELAVVTLVAIRFRRGLRAAGSDSDILARIGAAARDIIPSPRVAAILATELAVFYYAFASCRRSPNVSVRSRAFSIHQQSGVADLFMILAGVSLIETVLVHLVLVRWSATAAWALSALSIYGMIFLIALSRAFRLRPPLLQDGELIARSGILWTVRIPLTAITSMESAHGDYDMKLPPASQPNIVFRLAAPVTARGMYGRTRQISSLALAIDHRNEFERAIRHEI